MTTAFDSDLDAARGRVMLNRYVGRDISQWIDDDDDAMDLVVQDVLSQWQADDDLGVFWTHYANAVEYAPPTSHNEYREGFGEGEDLDGYYRAVWSAHVASLRSIDDSPNCLPSQPRRPFQLIHEPNDPAD
jgi:hypothetical protein